jgi:hypothetical protein
MKGKPIMRIVVTSVLVDDQEKALDDTCGNLIQIAQRH